MQIYLSIISPIDSKTQCMCFSLKEKVKVIYQKITLSYGLCEQSFDLFYQGSSLHSKKEKILQHTTISQQQTIQVVTKLKGGGLCDPINFNNLKQSKIKNFNQNAPDYRTISRGLNLQGICKNTQCSAHNKKVWIVKGFGQFFVNKQIYTSECPLCKQFCQQINNIGLFMASCVSKGMIKGQKKQQIKKFKHENLNDFLTFQDKDETRVNWLYLQMDVKEL